MIMSYWSLLARRKSASDAITSTRTPRRARACSKEWRISNSPAHHVVIICQEGDMYIQVMHAMINTTKYQIRDEKK
jgi:hypothetical protein